MKKRHREALIACSLGAFGMFCTLFSGGNALFTSIIGGFVTLVVAFAGLHLGMWVRGCAT